MKKKILEWKYDRQRKMHYSGHYRIEKYDWIGIQYVTKYRLTSDELGRPSTLRTAKKLAQKHSDGK